MILNAYSATQEVHCLIMESGYIVISRLINEIKILKSYHLGGQVKIFNLKQFLEIGHIFRWA